MFTGIIEEMGRVRSVEKKGGAVAFTITAPLVCRGMKVGDSVSVNGACLTVLKSQPPTFVVEAMEETITRTNLGWLSPNDRVNLEQALPADGRFHGHIVQGHVDDVGVVAQVTTRMRSKLMRIKCSANLGEYMVEKGCIAVDGVSLTIVECKEDWFSVALIPYTLQATTLGFRKPGDIVNLEVDMLAKYLRKFVQAASQIAEAKKKTALLELLGGPKVLFLA